MTWGIYGSEFVPLNCFNAFVCSLWLYKGVGHTRKLIKIKGKKIKPGSLFYLSEKNEEEIWP